MLRSRFLWKLYAGYVALIILTTLTVAVLVFKQAEETALEEIRENLRAKAVLLRALALRSLTGAPEKALQDRIRSLGQAIEARLTVLRADGVVIADSSEEPWKMDNHGGRPEVREAYRDGVGSAVRLSGTLGEEMMYLAVAVREDGALRGCVRAALPLAVVDQKIADLRDAVALGGVIAAVLALVLGFVVTHRVTRRLRSMGAVAGSIASGNYEQKVKDRSQDEIGQLALALNQMAEQLRTRVETITRERNKFLTILGSMVEGLVAVDRNQCVIHMNDVAGEVLGAEPSECVGKRLREVTARREVRDLLEATLHGAAEKSGEVTFDGRSGEQVIELHASPLRDGSGELAGGVLILHDITRLRRLETIRRDFVANVSHELKTPVTAIRGLVETLIDAIDMDADTQRRFLTKAYNQSRRLASLVTDLLTLSRMESHGYVLERRPVDLRGPVMESVNSVRPEAEEKGLAVETHLPEQAVTVLGEEGALRQIFDNLLSNAVRYTATGGGIEVRLFTEEVSAVVEVADTGIGIAPEHQDRVFERFYRVDKARSRELGGTGLGLSIVKHFAGALGGDVSVDSRPGEGSTFRVRLPRRDDRA